MTNFAFTFPGQGSQALNAMDNFANLDIVRDTFNFAKEVLNVDYWQMLQEELPDNINDTINTQPLMLTASYATYLAWDKTNPNKQPAYVAGHSLGEYTALVANGTLNFKDALQLVYKRASYMQQAVKVGDGAMAAVLGLDDELVIEGCAKAVESVGGIAEGVNFNSPGQVVIAGNKSTIEKAVEILKISGARMVKILPVSVPSHCALMKPAAEKLANFMQSIQFYTPKIAIVQNINAQATNNIEQIKDGLLAQLYSPVRWTDTIRFLAQKNINYLIECGPGKVLTGLNKRINSEVHLFNMHSEEDIQKITVSLGG